jgi:hypothetical protein
MKIANDAEIPIGKIRDYLLTWRPKKDKSKFLSRGGYSLANWEQLLSDIRHQLLPLNAIFQESTSYGDIYRISGLLRGPNGNLLNVRTVWQKDKSTEKFRFITLIPERGNIHEV